MAEPDEDKTEAAIRKGREAESLLANPVLTEAFDHVKANIIGLMEASALDDVQLREAVISLKLVNKVRQDLRVALGHMQVALNDLRVRQAQEAKAVQLGQ